MLIKLERFWKYTPVKISSWRGWRVAGAWQNSLVYGQGSLLLNWFLTENFGQPGWSWIFRIIEFWWQVLVLRLHLWSYTEMNVHYFGKNVTCMGAGARGWMYSAAHNVSVIPNRCHYRTVPKFLDTQVWANSADPDQTAPRGAVWSGSTLFAIPSASFRCVTQRKSHLVQILGWLQLFGCPNC